ncbi:MAG: hypothetical protein V1775_03590 [Bacteroidota bacterium]
MKPSFLKQPALLAALLLIPAFSCLAQSGVKTKSMKKEFVVGQDVRLNIETSFGKVHCNVWDKNQMTIDVLVTADARSDKDAQRLLDQITPEITGNSSLVEIKTIIGNTGSNGKSKSFSIDYTINMPRSTTLTAENRFGDLFIDESTGPVKIDIEYGNLTINRLSNPSSSITLKFSNGTIHNAGDVNFNLQYSTLNNNTASDIRSKTRFSTLDLGSLSSAVLDSEYDTYTVEKIREINGSGKFSSLKIDRLEQKIDMNVEYGGLEIKSVSPSFSIINIIASFNGISLEIPSDASYRLNADMSFGECRIPKGSAVTVTEKSHTSRSIIGIVGSSKNPAAKVNIKGRNADIDLY